MNRTSRGAVGGPIRILFRVLTLETLILAYFGPDTMMPLGSALAAGIGVFLMFWQRGVRFVKSTLRRFSGDRAESQSERD